ncbi:MAG: amino acid adenylation domain-containing protein [bacterium]
MQNSIQGFHLSPQQKTVWKQQQAAGALPFLVSAQVLIEGNVQEQILRRALQEVIGRHEILRTTFHRPPGIRTPFQVISEAKEPALESFDLAALDRAKQEAKIKDHFAAEGERSFDFDHGPLLRVTCFIQSKDAHTLTISLPALCADSLSLVSLVEELGSVYEAQLSGSSLPAESMQYADFAEWQNELLETEDESSLVARAYWQKQEAETAAALNLPLEKRREGKQGFQPESVSIALDSKHVANIETLAREHNSSTRAVLFACWQALLWRLTNQSDFVIHKLSDGRQLKELAGALGPYAKYLPVACHCEDVSFAEHLQRAQAALNQAEEWQEHFDPSRFAETTRDSVAFDFIDQPEPTETGGLRFSVIRQYACISAFKLKLSCRSNGESINAELIYDAQVFDQETIERAAGYFQRLVANTSVSAAPSTIGAIDLLPQAERQRLVIELNQTASAFSAAKCIHELFEDQAARTPNAIALVCADRELSYRELNARANQLAHLLIRRGVSANSRVGLCMKRSAESIVALLGILKAGGTYVPLNPDHPPARLALQLAESGAVALIVNGSVLNQSLDFTRDIISLELDRTLLEEPDTNPPTRTSPESLVYVVYTSGSTGIPKGVAVRQQGLVNYTEFILNRLAVKEPLHFATVSTITADLGNTCIFPSLVSGGCLHIITDEVALAGELFAEYLAKRPIDVLKIVPSHLNALLGSEPYNEVLPLRYLILGGEVLSWELLERIARAKRTCAIINHYGPTETTVGSLTFKVDAHLVSPYSLTVPVGRPIANTRAYILDGHLHPTPVGVAGDLFLAGAGVAAGYLNQPAETATRFVPDPFSGESDARLYRTGDRVRYLPDGNIEFLGRGDQQVKIRGFRVELGEIESALTTHQDVRQAVVIAETVAEREGADSGSLQRLIAYIVSSEIRPPTTDDLRSCLQQHLPDYMLPSMFVFLKSLPLTPNGKIDRVALPAPDETRPDLQRRFVAPRTPVEKKLAAIWAEFLKLNEVGVHDNFFELGGHSLLATQIVSRMRKVFALEIPLRSLFESPTVAELAEQVEGVSPKDTEILLAEIDQLSEEEVERLLALESAENRN